MPIDSDRRRRGLIYGLAAAAIQVLLALLTTAAKLPSGVDDTDLYFRYATMALEGKVPYRDYLVCGVFARRGRARVSAIPERPCSA